MILILIGILYCTLILALAWLPYALEDSRRTPNKRETIIKEAFEHSQSVEDLSEPEMRKRMQQASDKRNGRVYETHTEQSE